MAYHRQNGLAEEPHPGSSDSEPIERRMQRAAERPAAILVWQRIRNCPVQRLVPLIIDEVPSCYSLLASEGGPGRWSRCSFHIPNLKNWISKTRATPKPAPARTNRITSSV